MDIDFFDCQGWDFGNEDTAESVRNGCVDADQGEGGVVLFVLVELDFQI